MAAEFVPLADLLRAPAANDATIAPLPRSAPNDVTIAPQPRSAPNDRDERAADDERDAGGRRDRYGAHAMSGAAAECAAVAAVRDARLFRARLADAFDDAAARLLRELAADVLARELRLAPCDLAAIVQRIAARAPVVRVRLAACDVVRGVRLARTCGAQVVEDPALASGDAVVELAGGALDARLGVRLATVLEAFA